MEESGSLVRGMFVDGFGAAQFAERETVDLLRREDNATVTVTLDCTDPANLFGTAITWPEPAPFTENAGTQIQEEHAMQPVKAIRRSGSLVVIRGGRALLYVSIGSGRVLAFDSTQTLLRSAATALAESCSRRHGASITLKDCNGLPLNLHNPMTAALRYAGFSPTPQGLKLYR